MRGQSQGRATASDRTALRARSVVTIESEDVDQCLFGRVEQAAKFVRLTPMEQAGCGYGDVTGMSNLPLRKWC